MFSPAGKGTPVRTLLAASLFSLLVLPIFAPPLPAQEPPSIATTRQDPRFHTLAEHEFLAYEASLTTHCTDIHPDWTKASHHVYGAIATDQQGYPYTATWAEQVPGTACGQPRRFRALVLVRRGSISTLRMLPGDSETSEQLEHDLRESLLTAAEAFSRDIKSTCAVDVLDSHIVGAAPQDRAIWHESWLVRICGHSLNVPITFLPDATGPGASFNISSANISAAH
jgi:hypothetical protein